MAWQNSDGLAELAKPFSCSTANVSYEHRVDDPTHYNFCMVPDSSYDAVLFVAVALLVATAASVKMSALNVLLVGALCQCLAYTYNLGRFGNSITLWLGMEPAEVFFYVFLPPLLLDSSVRVDYFLFKKVLLLSLTFAFGVVAVSTFMSIPILLYGLGLGNDGWTWVHVALFSSMVASTDAVAVSANLKAGGAPELLSALLEGESLFNDASGLVLFDIFLKKLAQQSKKSGGMAAVRTFGVKSLLQIDNEAALSAAAAAAGTPLSQSSAVSLSSQTADASEADTSHAWALAQELFAVSKEFVWLAGGGLVIGLFFGILTTQMLRWLQWRRVKPHVEVSVTLGGAYFVYYVANAYLLSSGVIAVVCYGLYGASSMTWHMSIKCKREGWMGQFWDVLAFGTNGIIFFYVGVSSANFLIRLSGSIGEDEHSRVFWAIGMTLPLIYLTLTLLRGLLIAAFTPLIRRLSGSDIDLSWQGVVFATMGGLRGSVSLILAQTVLTLQSKEDDASKKGVRVTSEMGIYTAGYVLMTLLINGPLLTPLMTWLKLNAISSVKKQIHSKTKAALLQYTESVIQELRGQGAEMMRGVDWGAVEAYVDLKHTLEKVLPESTHPVPDEVEPESDDPKPPNTGGMGLDEPLLGPAEREQSIPSALQKGSAWLRHQIRAADENGLPSTSSNGQLKRSSTFGELLAASGPSEPSRLVATRLSSRGELWQSSMTRGNSQSLDLQDQNELTFGFGSGRKAAAEALRQALASEAGGGSGIAADGLVRNESTHRSPRVNENGDLQSCNNLLSAAASSSTPSGLLPENCDTLEQSLVGQSKLGTTSHNATSIENAPSVNRYSSSQLQESLSENEFTLGFSGGRAAAAALKKALATQQQQHLKDSTRTDSEPHTSEVVAPIRPSPRPSLESATFNATAARSTAIESQCATSASGKQRAPLLKASDLKRLDDEYAAMLREEKHGNCFFLEKPLHASEAIGMEPTSLSAVAAAAFAADERPSRKMMGSGMSREGSSSLKRASSFAQRLSLTLRQGSSANPILKVGQSMLADHEDSPSNHVSIRMPSYQGDGGPRFWRSSHMSHPFNVDSADEPFEAQDVSGQSPQDVDDTVLSAFLAHVEDDAEARDPHGLADRLHLPVSPKAEDRDNNIRSAFLNGPIPSISEEEELNGGKEAFEEKGHQQVQSNLPGNSGKQSLTSGQCTAFSRHQGVIIQGATSISLPTTGWNLADKNAAMSALIPCSGSTLNPMAFNRLQGAQNTLQEMLEETQQLKPTQESPLPQLRDLPSTATGPLHAARRPGRSPHMRMDPMMSLSASSGRLSAGTKIVFKSKVGQVPESEHVAGDQSSTAGPGLREPSVLKKVSGWLSSATNKDILITNTSLRMYKKSEGMVMPSLHHTASDSATMNTSHGSGSKPLMAGVVSAAFSAGSRPLLQDDQGLEDCGSDNDLVLPCNESTRQEAISEYRVRLISGLKRYFHTKHEEGLLSGQGMRILDYCCGVAADHPENAIDLWTSVEEEVSGHGWVAWLHFNIRCCVVSINNERRWWPFKRMIGKFMQWIAAMLARYLSRVMMVGLEVALEMWQALTVSPQAQWLDYAGDMGILLRAELNDQAELAWRFIIDREIEAPDRFQAIQSHRAAMAVLRQQQGFVQQLYEAGMVDEHEVEGLTAPIERRMWKLEMRGPRWKQPSLTQVLTNVPFLMEASQEARTWFRSFGRLARFSKGEAISTDGEAKGLFIVVNGMVRIELASEVDDAQQEGEEEMHADVFYIGTGGVGGLTRSLLGGHLTGSRVRVTYYAEANALGKGPVLFLVPQECIEQLQEEVLAGNEDLRLLQLGMFRLAGQLLLERQQRSTVGSIVQLLVSTVHSTEQQLGLGKRCRLRLVLDSPPGSAVVPGDTRHTLQRTTAGRGERMRMSIMNSIFDGTGPELKIRRRRRRTAESESGSSSSSSGSSYSEGSQASSKSHMTGVPRLTGVGAGTVEQSFVEISDEEEDRLTRRCVERAVQMFESLKTSFRQAELITLVPGQAIVQRSTLILMRGSLIQKRVHLHSVAHRQGSAVVEAVQDSVLPVFKPPSLLLWLPDYLNSGLSQFFKFGEAVVYIAGPHGATLLACDVLMGGQEGSGSIEVLKAPSAVSASLLKATVAAAAATSGSGEVVSGAVGFSRSSSIARAVEGAAGGPILGNPLLSRSTSIRFHQHL